MESYLEASLTIADLSTVDPDNERYVCLASNKEGSGTQASSMVKVLVSGIVITLAGIGATAFSIYFFRKSMLSKKSDIDMSTNLHGSASPMPGRLRPLPSLPKPRWSMPMKRQTQSTPIAILDFLKPIPVAMLKKEFNRRLANEETLFTYEYEALPKLLGEEHSQACQNNRDKNRFRNIISYDHSRVILSLVDNDPRSDYINASYIDGYNEEKKYIATQGPMQNTVQDFWRMIWETRSSTILMLSNLVENCQNKVCKYWSETDTMAYGDFRVTLIGTDKMDYYIARKFLLTKETAATRREVTQFHFLAWPDFGVPDDPTDLLKFHQTVMKSVPRQNHPIVVHCSAGVGRTGTFITIDAMLEMMTEEKQVDVFGFVSKMRRNRSFMVQAKAQYVFIYQALLDSHLREDVTKAGKFKLWPPSALISQIKIATAQRTEGNSEDGQKGENEI
ncbi:receptor-type tyrosine-protein phosphatase alpha-like isoform X1 [Branchiostoma lanceolatum]|uniref:receptor-type tyrosine-protein phosphatase alpha-like isoform X1 n=2 Tax=Branchiostoma lanceolatum TaxID=7740 RepID=UPI0034556A49